MTDKIQDLERKLRRKTASSTNESDQVTYAQKMYKKGIELSPLSPKEVSWINWHHKLQATFQVLQLWDMTKNGAPPNDQQDKEIAWMMLCKAMPDIHTSMITRSDGDPHELYKHLVEYYNSKLVSAKFNTKEEWLQIRQGPTEKYRAFFERWFKALTKVISSGTVVLEEDKVHQLTKAVHRRYFMDVQVTRKLLMKGEDLSLDDVSAQLQDSDNWKQCSEHARPTHDRVPSWVVCRKCKQKGHYARDCKNKKRQDQEKEKEKEKEKRKDGKVAKADAKQELPKQLPLDSPNEENSKQKCNVVRHMAARASTPAVPALIDSGCTKHMSPNKEHFHRYEPFDEPKEIYLADQTWIEAVGVGDIITRGPEGHELKWENAYHVPALTNPLFSCPQIITQGYSVLLHRKGAQLIYAKDRSISFEYGTYNEKEAHVEVSWKIVDKSVRA